MSRMQPKRQAAIKAKVNAFARGERVDLKKLAGSSLIRIRVGDDRVIIDEQTNLVLVVNAGPRSGIYKEEVMGGFNRTVIDGKPFVLVPEEEFEDMMDVIMAKEIMARIEAGEETWPAELVYELFDTDSRIRTFRNYRKMTVSDLATAAGISQPYLSEIESGKKTGSVDVLKRIAAALKVDLDDIVV